MITVTSIIFLPVEVEAAQTVTSGEVEAEFPTNTNAAFFTDTLLKLELHDV